MKKKIFSMILAALIVSSPLAATATFNAFAAETQTTSSEVSADDFEYTVTDNEAKITKYKGTATNVVIPSKLNGVPVKIIGNRAFMNNRTITSVTIPSGVTTIEDYAFYYNDALTSVVFPDTIESIGNYGFGYCSSLNFTKLPSSLKNIGTYAFISCVKIDSLTLPQKVENIGNQAFRACKGITSLNLSKNIKSIGSYAFSYCTSLTDVNLETDMSVLGEYVFSDCTALKNITIPKATQKINKGFVQNCTSLQKFTIPSTVTSIEDYAFNGCQTLTDISLPTDLENIGLCAFKDCRVLKLSSIPSKVTVLNNSVFQNCYAFTEIPLNDNIKEIGNNAFNGCTGIKKFELKDSVKTIGSYAFSGCNALTEVTIPETVETLQNYAFSSCNALKSFTLKNSKTKLGIYIFAFCHALESVSLPEKMTAIPDYFLYDDTMLKSVTIPSTVTSIGQYAFRNNAFESIVIPAGITKIGTGAFSYCKNLKSINIPDKVTEYPNYLFSNCSSLASIPFGNNVTALGTGVFENCTSITDVTIPEKIKTIGTGLFVNCTGLKTVKLQSHLTEIPNSTLKNTAISSIDLPSGITKIGNQAFDSCKNIKKISIPSGVKTIDNSAFARCTSLEEINIPSQVTTINDYVFTGCSSLKTIELPGTITKICSNAFSSSGLTDVEIPDSVKIVDTFAYYNCKSLKNVKFSKNMTTISNQSLASCTSLESVTIPENIKKIDNFAFHQSALREIFVPKETELSLDNSYTLSSNPDLIIYSTPDSFVKAYADKYERLFCDSSNGIKTLTDKETGVSVKGVIESGMTLKVTPIDTNVFVSSGVTNVVPNKYYEISLTKNGKTVEGSNAYEILIPFSTDSTNLKGIFIDGDTVSDSVVYKTAAGNVRFASTKFGKFAAQDYSHINICDTTDAYIMVIGGTVSMNLKSAGGRNAYYRYTVDVAPKGTEEWTKLGNNVTTTDFTYTPEKTGLYDFRIKVKDSYNTTTEKTVTVKINDPLKNTSTVSKKTTMLGNTITIKGSAEGGIEDYKYKFYYKQSSASSWKTLSASEKTADFKAPSAASYDLKVVVTTSDGASETKTFTVTVKKPLENNSTVSAEKCIIENKVTLTGSAANGMGGYLYAFYYKKASDTKWTAIGSPFAKPTSATFTPTVAGKYNFKIVVKDSEENIVSKEYLLTAYDKLVNSSTVSAESVIAGNKVTLNAKASGGFGGYTYALMYKKTGSDKWTKIGTKYGTADTGSFVPKTVTTYDIMINVKDSGGNVKSKTFKLEVLPTLKNKSTISAETVKVGQKVTLNGAASGGTGGYTYALMYKKHTSSTWVKIGQKYTDVSTGSFIPGKAVLYDVRIIVKDSSGKTVKKDFALNVTK